MLLSGDGHFISNRETIHKRNPSGEWEIRFYSSVFMVFGFIKVF